MAIFKAKVESQFSVIANAALQDSRLSYEATGLLAMMLSLPDDWEIHKTWLQNQKVKCGRDKLTNMMKELVETGYVRKVVKQDESGRLDGVDWLVYGEAVQLENRTTEKPSNGKPVTTKETSIQKKQETKRFAAPTEKEVFDYLSEKGYPYMIEAEKFCNFYESKGWKVGKNPMKNWKAAASGWITRSNLVKKQAPTYTPPADHDPLAALRDM